MNAKFHRDFILSFFAQFTFTCVFCILIPAIPLYASRFEAKESEIGILVGIFNVSSLLLRPFIGRALLKIPEKRFMISGSAIYAISCLAYLFAPPFWPLLAVRAFQGIGLSLFSTASLTLIANNIPESHRGQFMGYYTIADNLAFALGPFLGIFLIGRFSFVALFLVCVGTSLCSFFLALRLEERGYNPSSGDPFFSACNFLNREALPSSTLSFMLSIIWGSVSAFIPLYALKHGVSNPGIFFAFFATTLISGRSLCGKVLDVYDRKKIIMSCLFLIILATVILPFSGSVSMLALAAIMFGAGWAFVYPSLMVYAVENAGYAKGPAMASFNAMGDLGTGIGPMLMGMILERTSYPVMFICLILIGVTNVAFFRSAIRRETQKMLTIDATCTVPVSVRQHIVSQQGLEGNSPTGGFIFSSAQLAPILIFGEFQFETSASHSVLHL